MKKIIMYILLGILAIIVVAVLIALSNPLRKSDEEIRGKMLELTPIGMSMEDVIAVIKDNEQWYKNHRSYEPGSEYEYFDYGYIKRAGAPVMAYDGFKGLKEGEIIGTQTIKADIGHYNGFFEMLVFAYWAFDEDGKLVDLAITKSSYSI